MARLGLSQMQSLMIISGAFGVFRRNAPIDVGGFSENTVGEDFELVVKLHLLAFVAVVFTFGIFISVAILVLEEIQLRRIPRARHLAILTLIAVAENFGYRQINNLWRVRGWWHFLRKKTGWGLMTRNGFQRA